MKIKLNPDKKQVKEIREKLKENGGYCPCRLIKNEETKCICKDFKDAVNSGIKGYCHCELYYVD